MRHLNVISWGGGTQSTALLLMALKGEIEDYDGKPLDPDYIIFADTGDESEMVYSQVFKVIDYVEKNYGKKIIVTKKNKIKKTDDEIIAMIKSGEITTSFSTTPYADLYQEQLLFYRNEIKRATIVPYWVIDNRTGEITKLPGRQCTIDYKIDQVMRELRNQIGIQRFSVKSYKVHTYLGFTVDEIGRVKPSPLKFVDNRFPLVDKGLSKIDCINYVEKELGFRPRSTACNMCFAMTFDRVYDIYQNDEKSWKRLLDLDDAMEHYDHSKIRGYVYMFRWQAVMRKRLADIDMDELFAEKHKYTQLSIYDVVEEEEQLACMGGCFI
jgi:hypothetical protein